MGVDVDTYRCRVGMFVGSRGCVVMLSLITFGRMVKWLGSLSLVRMLLFIAGVEKNPGPVDEYIFHYQYLLIEVGTDVMRKVFDVRVGYNFGKYLATNVNENKKLQSLISANIITTDQTKDLPPNDNNPKSTNYDITLLSCLLRNICGLRGHSDAVWKKPQPNDFSLEADLARLKECRNDLLHSGTVLKTSTVLTIKWMELRQILLRLNRIAGIPHMSNKIDTAKVMPIDVQLKAAYDRVLNAWADMDTLLDRGIVEIKLVQSDIQRNLSEMKSDQRETAKEMKKRQQETVEVLNNVAMVQTQQEECLHTIKNTIRPKPAMDESDLRNHLMEIYEEKCRTLPVTPLCVEDEDKIQLLTIYQRPNMSRIPYHRSQKDQDNYRISSYKELLFNENDKCFRNIFITGDAGVGKTTFCKCMAYLWTKRGENIGNDKLQEDVDLMVRFDYVFYISLRKTVYDDVITMIIEHCFYTKSKDRREEIVKLIEHVLKHNSCLIILDGLDEWSPQTHLTKHCALPRTYPSKMCTYLTTTRPYKIENVRLSHKDLDIQVQMTGISECSTECLVKEIVNHISHKTKVYKNPDNFIRDINKLGLQEQLRIPMLAAHLIEVWFDHELTYMSLTRLYSIVLDMLFKKAVKRNIEFPESRTCTVQMPDLFASLVYINKYFSLLEKVCLLSYRSLFKRDEQALALVFTIEQLMSEPYNINSEEINCLCKIGILSKNKVIGAFGKQKQKLSFLHQSYLEFFAALFVSSFDLNYAFAGVVKTWNTINDVVQYSQFFQFLAGFSGKKTKTKVFLENAYNAIRDDLTLCRLHMIFHYDRDSYRKYIQSLQTMVIKCFKESIRLNDPMSCKLEDFVFDKKSFHVDHLLKQLMVLNRKCVKSLCLVNGEYFDTEFGEIKKLQCLHVGNMLPEVYGKFIEFMLKNKATLHTVSIKGRRQLIEALPVERLNHLTSLFLTDICMKHDSLEKLVTFLSRTVRIENIRLSAVACIDHRNENSKCSLTLNLQHHKQLHSLSLELVNVFCYTVKKNRIKYISLSPLSTEIVSCYTKLFDSIWFSQLEYFVFKGNKSIVLDSTTKKKLKHTVKMLPCIKSLSLYHIDLPDNVILQLCPSVKQVDIHLTDVTMSCECFHAFIKHLVNKTWVMKLWLDSCNIKSVDCNGQRILGLKESVDYVHAYLTSKHSIHTTIITDKLQLYFKTKGCH